MKRTINIIVIIFLSVPAFAQHIYKIKTDSLLVTNDSCTAELNLENRTKDTLGFLYNKGNGRTEFRKGLKKVNDSIYVIGADTLNIAKGGATNAWKLTGNVSTNPASNFIGTGDNQSLVFRTNNIPRMRISNAGNLLINTTTDNGIHQLQLYKSAYVDSLVQIAVGSVVGEKQIKLNKSATAAITVAGNLWDGAVLSAGLSTMGIHNGVALVDFTGSSSSFNAPFFNVDYTHTNSAYSPTGVKAKIYRTIASNTNLYGFNADIQQTSSGNSFGYYSKVVNYGAGKAYAFYADSGHVYVKQNIGINNLSPVASLDIAGNAKMISSVTNTTTLSIEPNNLNNNAASFYTGEKIRANLAAQNGNSKLLWLEHTNPAASDLTAVQKGNYLLFSKTGVSGIVSYVNMPMFGGLTVGADTVGTGPALGLYVKSPLSTGSGTWSGFYSAGSPYSLYGQGAGAAYFVNEAFATPFDATPLFKYGVRIKSTGAFTNPYASNAATNYGLHIESKDADVNYGIYVNSGKNYMAEKLGIGTSNPVSLLTLAAGTTSIAPFQYTNGTNLSSIVNGAKEYDGSNEFLSAGGVRYTMAKTLTATAALDFGATAAGTSTNLTITLTGAADGDAVSIGVPNAATVANGSFSAWVSAANTITIRFTNNDLTNSLNPASGTFRVSIIKY